MRMIVNRIVSRAARLLGIVGVPMPSEIYLVVNSRCNLRCEMCDVGTDKDGSQFWKNMISEGDLQPGLIKKLIDEVKHFKPRLAFTSTEPLLYEPLADCISYAAGAGIKTQVTTNGFLLEKKAGEIIGAGLSSLWVSIDGPEHIHDRIRGVKGSFQRAVRGLEKALALRRGSALEEVSVNVCISPSNQGSIVELLDRLSVFSLDVVTLSHMNYITEDMAERHNRLYGRLCRATPSCVGELDPQGVDPGILWTQLKEIEGRRWSFKIRYSPRLRGKRGVEVFYREPDKVVAKRACSIPWDVAQICANGDLIILTRCFHLPMGNLKDSAFGELWNGEKMRFFRSELRRVGMFPACTRCCGVL